MDVHYYGGNCITFTNKDVRLVIDDNLEELGLKSITKPTDIVLFTGPRTILGRARLLINQPGEYEVSGMSIVGIASRAHVDKDGIYNATIYKILVGDSTYLVTGHIYPDLTDEQLESIGVIDVMIVPVGGNGYTLDPIGALQLIKKIEPKIVIPTHYADQKISYPVEQYSLEQVLKGLSMDLQETLPKLRIKVGELAPTTQLIALTRS